MLESHLTDEERALLPLMTWAQAIIAPAQDRVLACLDRLAQQYPHHFNPATLEASVHAAFARPIIDWSQRTLILELGIARHCQQLTGESPQARFADFVAWIGSTEQQRRLRTDYPLLHQDIRLRCRQVERFLIQLLTRVARDLPRLAALQSGADGSDESNEPDHGASGNHGIGPLLHFTTQMGERHCHGKSVTRLCFGGNHTKLYYKPRSVAPELAYGSLLAWLAHNGIQPGQRGAVALDRGEYGYVAEVRFQPCHSASELTQYYRRFGGLAALTHALGSTAFNATNLIAAGEWPVIIDPGTLLQPGLIARYGKNAQRPPFAASALYSGLLPRTSPDNAPHASALSLPQTALFSRTPVNAGTDQVRLVMQKVALPFAANMAHLQDEPAQPHKHNDAICEGFEQTYRGLLAHKPDLLAPNGPLAAFRCLRVRAVLRESHIYGAALMALTHPNYLESEDQRERLIARLRPVNVSGTAQRRAHLRKTPLLRCWPSERLALLRGDVPYFTAQADSLDAHGEQGETLDTLFAVSAWGEAERSIKHLSRRDLQHQLEIVRTAVASICPPPE